MSTIQSIQTVTKNLATGSCHIIFKNNVIVPMNDANKTVFGCRLISMQNTDGTNLWTAILSMTCSGKLTARTFCLIRDHVTTKDMFVTVRDMIENMKKIEDIKNLRRVFNEYILGVFPETVQLMNGRQADSHAVMKEMHGTGIKFVKQEDIKRVLDYIDPFYWS